MLSPLLPPRVTVGTLGGTIWRGYTDVLVVGGRSLGAVSWRLRPAHFFLGRLALDVELQRADGEARAGLRLGLGHRIAVRNLEAHLPLAALPPGITPSGWTGVLRADLEELSLRSGAVPRIEGIVELLQLHAPPPQGAAIGSYRLQFDAASLRGDQLVGTVQDLEGPMQVSGTVSLGADRSYVVEGLVAPRAGASEAVTGTLRFLGPPDAQGRRPFSVAGTY